MNSKLDRRIQYTRMILKESLMKLLKEKPISSITVKELCALADINRSTFYSHYSDQYDLLTQVEEEIIQDMNETLLNYNINQDEESFQMIEKIVEYVAANSDICETLFSENGDPSFKKRVMMLAHDYTVKSWMSSYPVDDSITSEYASLFAISGSIHILEIWLKNGMDKTPKEMAEIINNLTNKGLSSLR
ncbi:TetR/AcrR family transcriptional regulator [Mesobacillus maritimus]|uniref:TetR/AcrR family transcriptional regulator n=1 Tax=Mesobacillus maritimus TaxID=1643336 RepID=A0ABS7KA30_9BACI|nr:TetR-like C-terminal domain-containing protein [Mesobacillus maritimus]MBY0099139.1 TetR/AcrR family transcriptional regulator [Mesobacillus maritimus]